MRGVIEFIIYYYNFCESYTLIFKHEIIVGKITLINSNIINDIVNIINKLIF